MPALFLRSERMRVDVIRQGVLMIRGLFMIRFAVGVMGMLAMLRPVRVLRRVSVLGGMWFRRFAWGGRVDMGHQLIEVDQRQNQSQRQAWRSTAVRYGSEHGGTIGRQGAVRQPRPARPAYLSSTTFCRSWKPSMR